ncbi:hypothetical protein [Chryseobacterium camelliae]|nr:hypothetical protein [Chryseobacterium camelliae]
MVQRKVLGKRTDSELECYLKEGNRFTPEAVKMAFEILERRGRIFSEEEKKSVQRMIREKTESESVSLDAEKEVWKDYITDDPDAVPLYPRELIMILGFFLGTVPGAVLLGMNLIRLKNTFRPFLPSSWALLLLSCRIL